MIFGFSRKHIALGSFVAILVSMIWITLAMGQPRYILGTESTPKVGDKSPMFDLQGFELGEHLKRGPVVLVFYRGFF